MKKVIIARHGYYDDENLNDFGKRQMNALGIALKQPMNGDSVQMYSSTAPRAEQSAEILAGILGIGFDKHQFLWTGPDSPRGYRVDLAAVVQLIKSSTADIVIVVTHLEFSEELPCFVAKEMLGGISGFPSQETGKGEAWVIDCEAKTCVKLVPPIC